MAATAVVQSLVIFVFVVVGCFRGISAGKERIIGGYDTTISTEPYTVILRLNRYLACGGALIGDRFVLTAAHCVHGHKPNEFQVTGGTSYLDEVGERRDVDLVITPSSYDPESQHMDFAILRLSAPMTGTNIKTIPICRRPIPVGAKVKISGWGVTSEGGSLSNRLRSVVLKTISKANCRKAYHGELSITNSMLCAGEPGKDACTNDSGGPLVYNNEICGIVSFGIGCATKKYPGVYTDVYKVRQFINHALAKKS